MLENVKEKVVGCFCYWVSVFFVIRYGGGGSGGGCWRMLKRKLLGFLLLGFFVL